MRKAILRTALFALLGAALGLCLVASWVTQPLAGRIASTPAPVDPAVLERHVRALSQTFHPRDAAHSANLHAVSRYLTRELNQLGLTVLDQPYDADGLQVRNLIVRFGPTVGPRVIVGAHYDSHHITPGADDNASGVAGLMELARLLRDAPPTGPVDLVFYTLEEPPFFRTDDMGSARHAASLKAQGVQVRLMISLEMIGYFSDAPRSQKYPLKALELLYPTTGNFIGVVGSLGDAGSVRRVKAAMAGATDLPVYSINAPAAIPGIDFSDHLNYWENDFPALMVTDTSFFRNLAYHTANDTAQRLDYRRMAKVVQGVDAAVRVVSGEK